MKQAIRYFSTTATSSVKVDLPPSLLPHRNMRPPPLHVKYTGEHVQFRGAVLLPDNISERYQSVLHKRSDRDPHNIWKTLAKQYFQRACLAPKEYDPVGRGDMVAKAYLSTRFHSNFAITGTCLEEIQLLCGNDFKPKKILDFGAGTGASAMAAATLWPDTSMIVAIDPSPSMRDVGQRMTIDYEKQIVWRPSLVTSEAKHYDIVMGAFVLDELVKEEERLRIVHSLWQQTAHTLLLIDFGTPAGFERIKAARDAILATSSAIALAPCPHSLECPMKEDSWCHFTKRHSRRKLEQIVTDKVYGDDYYSYIALTRKEMMPWKPSQVQDSVDWGRLVRKPRGKTRHVLINLCTASGKLEERVLGKAIGEEGGYRAARSGDWGDVFPYAPPKIIKQLQQSKQNEEDQKEQQ